MLNFNKKKSPGRRMNAVDFNRLGFMITQFLMGKSILRKEKTAVDKKTDFFDAEANSLC